MKIAIATIFRGNHNYGGMLQAYALQRKIKDLVPKSYEVKTLNYQSAHNPLYPSLLSRCRQYSLTQIIEKFMMTRIERKTYLIADKLKVRHELFNQFSSEYISQSTLYNVDDIDKIAQDFDVLICGSDQIWNPNVINRVLLGDLGSNNQMHLISYAASIGRTILSDYEKGYYIPRLNKFEKISVRENSAKKILDELNIEQTVDVVLDPTMLLEYGDWNRITSERLIEVPYVLLYSFSDCRLKHQLVEYYKKMGLKVFYIPYAKQKYNTFDGKCKMIPLWDIGPREFLSLIKYANVVYTDSFHGTVFSILFNKEFYVYNRNKGNSRTSMNSRIYDLLKTLGLETQLLTNKGFDFSNRQKIEYDTVNRVIKKYRNASLDWLKNALIYD